MTDYPAARSLTEIQVPKSAPALPDGFEVRNGRLFHNEIDLMALVQRPVNNRGRIEAPQTPLYIRRLPALRENYTQLLHWFEVAKLYTGYTGELKIAYASKANPSQPVAMTVLQMGAAQECSSAFDVDAVRHAYSAGWIDTDRFVYANGFKTPAYMKNLVQLRLEGFENVVPIFDDLDEVDEFAETGLEFEVGLRSITESRHVNRFGMNQADMEVAAWRIMNTDNLTLTVFHAMQTVSMKKGALYLNALRSSMRQYAALYRVAPTLRWFNLGGGLPGRNSGVDFQQLLINVLETLMAVAETEGVPVPDLIVEPGRYMVENHAAKIFSVIKKKRSENGVPFYLIGGSIMSNFPDAWALGDQFTVLPINHWESEFGAGKLAGLTCDRDDVYPTQKMPDVPLSLPVDAEELYVGFFDCGAYQETLGGRGGSKHCMLPEGAELILDQDEDGEWYVAQHLAGQSAQDVLANLGYNSTQTLHNQPLKRVAW